MRGRPRGIVLREPVSLFVRGKGRLEGRRDVALELLLVIFDREEVFVIGIEFRDELGVMAPKLMYRLVPLLVENHGHLACPLH